MKVRTKIILIVFPLMLISIIAINLIFGAFFSSYLQSQEDLNLTVINQSVYSFIKAQMEKYNGSANDWGNWDETLNFINGDQTYIERNLPADTFNNLDINFIIFLKNDGTVYYKRFYDLYEQKFTDFDESFFNNFKSFAQLALANRDLSEICKFNGNYYYVAASDITDSKVTISPAGELIIGKLFDTEDIQKISGCSVISIDTVPWAKVAAQPAERDIVKGDKTLKFSCFIPGEVGVTNLRLTLEEKRELYLSGMNQMTKYLLSGALYTIGIAVVLFTLLSIYLTRPFFRLTRDVKNIDFKELKRMEINEKTEDEFFQLRRTINSLLERVDEEAVRARENEEKLYATLLSVGDGVIVVGKDAKIQFINPTAEKLTGWTKEDAEGRDSDEVLKLINEITGLEVESPIKEVFETEEIVAIGNHTVLISRDGTERPIEDTAAPVKDKNGEVIGCVIVFRDFTEKKEKQKEIEFLSYHDQLTGLFNRRYFEEELKRLDTNRNLPISIVYADVNGLKTINDAFGHNVGDQLIHRVADVLKDISRADEIISRTGGDEFVILLPKTDMPSTEKIVSRIEKKLEKIKVMGIQVSLSFGWDTKYTKDQSIWDTLKSAEGSMYHKKVLISGGVKDAVIESVVNAFFARYPSEKGHSERTVELCAAMGAVEGMNAHDQEELKKAAKFHDLGMIALDEDLINNPGKLTDSQWTLIKSHPETGYRILSALSGYHNVAEYVLQHHERWDGKGYPKGLKGEAISPQARMIMIAGSYDSMRRDLSYRKAISQNDAIKELKKNARSQFDPNLVRDFIEKVLRIKY